MEKVKDILLVFMEALQRQKKNLSEKIYNFKANNNNVNLPSQFCLGSISKNVESEELSLKGNMYDFSVYYDAIDKFEVLNILVFSG